MRDVVIVQAARTPIGAMGGALKMVTAEELARVAIRGVLDKTDFDLNAVDQVVFGHCRQSSDNPDVARIAALRAGVPETAAAYTVMRHCASGMQAFNCGYMEIQTGQSDVVIVGGTESMSTAPFYIRDARYGLGTGNTLLLDSVTESQFKAQPEEIYGTFNMGQCADDFARLHRITREEQDEFSFSSQEKAAAAIASGRFKNEIVPVVMPQKKGDPIIFGTDEHPRKTTKESLAKLKAIFREGGTVTAGNSSGRNDGASALVLMSAEKAASFGLRPLALVRAVTSVAKSPKEWCDAPVPATKKALAAAGLSLSDINLIEMNEAFAAQCVACVKGLDIDESRLNVNGGAIALGHPVGNSGTRIIVTLLHEMIKTNQKYGLATLCAAAGMGMSTIIELI